MKFKYKKEELGASRIIESFLWIPKLISNEWRWLEFARWKETVLFHWPHIFPEPPGYRPITKETFLYRWEATEWLDGGTHDDTDWPRE